MKQKKLWQFGVVVWWHDYELNSWACTQTSADLLCLHVPHEILDVLIYY